MKNIFLILLVFTNFAFSQSINKHQWKDRLLLFIADSYDQKELTEQLKKFDNTTEALAERKLIIYQITPHSYVQGMKKNSKKISKKNALYQKYNTLKDPFKVILIGLDGGIKLNKSNLISPVKIFDKIDQMPMRQQELKIKN